MRSYDLGDNTDAGWRLCRWSDSRLEHAPAPSVNQWVTIRYEVLPIETNALKRWQDLYLTLMKTHPIRIWDKYQHFCVIFG